MTKAPRLMKRFWASWYAPPNQVADGIPWPVWITGERLSDGWLILCAVIDTEAYADVWPVIREFYPAAEERFVKLRPDNWQPDAGRFPS